MGYQDEEFSQYPVHIALLKEAFKKSVKTKKELSAAGIFGGYGPHNASINYEGEDVMLENAIVRLDAHGYAINKKEDISKISIIYILADDGETIFEFVKAE